MDELFPKACQGLRIYHIIVGSLAVFSKYSIDVTKNLTNKPNLIPQHILSVGFSSIWNKQGQLVGQLDNKNEGLLIFDTENEEVDKIAISSV